MIGCPVCHARIPVDEAMHHAHFALDGDGAAHTDAPAEVVVLEGTS